MDPNTRQADSVYRMYFARLPDGARHDRNQERQSTSDTKSLACNGIWPLIRRQLASRDPARAPERGLRRSNNSGRSGSERRQPWTPAHIVPLRFSQHRRTQVRLLCPDCPTRGACRRFHLVCCTKYPRTTSSQIVSGIIAGPSAKT